MIKDNILNIRKSIEQHAAEPDTIRLLAVSKTHSVEQIRSAHAAGINAFGENYLQEALSKIDTLRDLELEWHFIGHIQSRKCAEIAQSFDWVQTLDRLKVAEKLDAAATRELQVLIQVNIDADPNKSGIAPDEIEGFAAALKAFHHLRLRGLMCMPALKDSAEANRECFRRMKGHFDGLRDAGYDIDTLSMGMSQDYPVALEEGSTLIRIGTQIFGKR